MSRETADDGGATRDVDLRKRMLAIGLTACSVLLFEIAVTRVLSVVLWYHWAFLSVSLAMVGLGAPGVWFSFRPATPRLRNALLVAGGAALPVAVAGVISISPSFDDYQVVFCMFMLLVPFLCLGAATCILLLEARGSRIAPIYGADLLGASVAAAIVIPAMDLIPTPQLAALFGVLPLLAAWILGAHWRPIAGAAVVIFGMIAWGSPLEVTHSKNYDEAELKPFLERWTSTARLTFFDSIFWVKGEQGFGWGKGKRAQETPDVPQYWMEQDGSAGTPVTNFRGDLAEVGFMLDDVTAAAYEVVLPETVAIIGAGGGRDILSALVSGATSVDAVELNPHIVDIVTGPLKEFSGDPYHFEGVRPIVSEGRAFLTRTDRLYDMIQISMIDSWAATAAGAFSLSENNLYTREAYRLYWSRLTQNGAISTSRWARGAMGVELPRLVLLVDAALRDAGVENPKQHIAVLHAGAVGTVIASKRPFVDRFLKGLRKTAKRRGFKLWYPLKKEPKKKSRLYRAIEEGPDFLTAKGFDISPPTDDRPFFFQVLPALEPVDRDFAKKNGFNAEAVFALQLLMASLVVITAVLFFAPFVLARWMPRAGGLWTGSGYFAAIGLGFMLVEIPWLQRFILFLGHPSLAATAVLGSMLLGTGIGALASTRVGLARLRSYGVAVPLLLAIVNLSLAPLFESALALPFAGRVAVTAALLVPIGVCMGMFFPLGMMAFRDDHKAWFWAINGASGVLASVVSLAAAMAFGFTAVAWAGVAAYFVAWGLIRMRRGS